MLVLIAQVDDNANNWKMLLAQGAMGIMFAIAYWIREKAKERRDTRVEAKIDGNTALCATSLVSGGTLPKTAPCIPAVAKALSETRASCESSTAYADKAVLTAHEAMEKANIPIQSQDLLVQKLMKEIADLIAKEARHNANNVENNKVWAAEVERLKAKLIEVETKLETH